MVASRVLSVTEVNQFLKTLVESNSILKHLMVEGEFSNVKQAASGHLYFSLKDHGSKIDCVMFKNTAKALKFLPKEGLKVTLKGALGIYAPNGHYQITVSSMEPEGLGGLYQVYLELKEKLKKQGLFSKENKKLLPSGISRVGLVTSKTGAAIEDMISIIKRRNPLMDIVLFPSLVQGEEAARNIIQGIKTFNLLNNVDVIIIGRGGGSIEDLWAFNDEELARAIFDSQLPIISAVGHETDFTIADFVADLRAETPSGAAELVAEDLENTLFIYRQLEGRILKAMEGKIQNKQGEVENQRKRIMRFNPEKRIEEIRMDLDFTQERLIRSTNQLLKNDIQRLKGLKARITVGNPQNILQRGYVLVKDHEGKALGSVNGLKSGDVLGLHFKDGEVEAWVKSIKEKK